MITEKDYSIFMITEKDHSIFIITEKEILYLYDY